MKKIMMLFGVVGLAALLFAMSAVPREKTTAAQKAPDFSLKSLSGTTVSLSDYRGKVVVLNFWASWCPPCKEEIPDFVSVYGDLKEKGLVIIGIAVKSDRNDVQQIVTGDKINYPVALSDGQVEGRYGGLVGVPTTFIIDKNGNIAKKHIGMFTKSGLVELVTPLLK